MEVERDRRPEIGGHFRSQCRECAVVKWAAPIGLIENQDGAWASFCRRQIHRGQQRQQPDAQPDNPHTNDHHTDFGKKLTHACVNSNTHVKVHKARPSMRVKLSASTPAEA